jgi:hypothetical protein
MKFRRAIEHAATLDATAQRWADTNPSSVSHEMEVKTRKHILRGHVHSQPSDPLMPLLIGDCVHNFRHALDHLAYSLAIKISGSDPPPNETTTEFPIFTTNRTDFDSALLRKVGKPADMDPRLYAILEGLQPYNGGDNTLLALIHELDNLDKHRFPPLVAGATQSGAFHFGTFEGWMGPIRVGAFEDGAPILEFIPDPGRPMNMEIEFGTSIAFDQRWPVAPGALVIPLLGRMSQFLWERVILPLEEFT